MKRILSLDGGGVRGMSTLSFLAHLEQRLDRPLYEVFDLVVGTSIGAIIACLICVCRYTTEQILNLLDTKMLNMAIQRNGFFSKFYYSADSKRRLLHHVFGDLKLSDAKTNVVVTAHDITNTRPLLINSWKCQFDDPLWRILDGCTAVPVAFAGTKTSNDCCLMDGAFAANDPVLCAAAEAEELWPGEEHRILSVGTGWRCSKPSHDFDLEKVQNILSDSQLTSYCAKRLLKDKYLRVDGPIEPSVSPDFLNFSESNLHHLEEMGCKRWLQFGEESLKHLRLT